MRGADRSLQPLPEIGVFHRLFIGGFPAALDPLRHPFGNTLLDIFTVSIKFHL